MSRADDRAKEVIDECWPLEKWQGDVPTRTKFRQRIAAAIRAETERCAKIAETVKSGPTYYVDRETGAPADIEAWARGTATANAGSVFGGDIIAAAIREDE